MTNSKVLDKKLKERKPQLNHLKDLDKILSKIDPVHFDKVMEIRNTIELTLLNNPKSSNEIVSYLSESNKKIQKISEIRMDKINKIINELTLS